MINRFAVFTDETENFVFPYAPKTNENVKFKIRTAQKDFEKVSICIDGTMYKMIKEKPIQASSLKSKLNVEFDFYTISIPITKSCSYYYILEEKSESEYYYNRAGFVEEVNSDYNFSIIVDFEVPNWARGAVMYQIYVDRFFNGDVNNDVVSYEYMYRGKTWVNGKQIDVKEFCQKEDDWYSNTHLKDNTRFYGGDLKGVMDKLDYLVDLGVEVIYFNPLFVSPSNHKYDTQDYDYVDPHIGVIVKDKDKILNDDSESNTESEKYIERVTNFENLDASNELLRELIEKAHSKGIKVILDGVFNHCGSFNKWIDREKIYKGREGYFDGAFISKDSKYRNFFRFYSENWPDNLDYERWWGYEELPKLNYESSKELFDYIMRIAAKWVSPPYNADGWRLDVAADLGFSREFNHKFWKEFRKSVKNANPNAIILAEHYEDAKDWLNGDEWDSIMNYQCFMEPISYYFTGLEKHSVEMKHELCGNSNWFINTMKWFQGRVPIQSLEISMNQLSNHDHSRFMTRTNCSVGRIHTRGTNGANIGINKGIFKEATVMQMTWPGAPTLYYGDEAGVCGWTDPDSRRTYPWGREDMELLGFTKEIIKIHKRFSCIKTGSFMYLNNDYNLISYARFNDNEKVIVLLNNNDNAMPMEVYVPVWMLGIENDRTLKIIFKSTINNYATNEIEVKVHDGQIKLLIEAYSSMIITM